jgi:signal peptidase I
MKQLIIFLFSLTLAVILTALFLNKDPLSSSRDIHTNERSDLNKFCREVTVKGRSMEPVLFENDLVCAYAEEPQVGELAVFRCKNCGLDEPSIKRLKKIETGCYWVEGDNPEHSYDSRNFGFLCPGNLEYIWSVRKE